VRYIQKEKCYKPEAMIAQSMTHFAMDGWLLHSDSEDAKKQQDQDKLEDELHRKFAADMEKCGADSGTLFSLSMLSRSVSMSA
jgi:dynein intermediate chain 1, axonemal